ncbi:hypothetical protein J7K43_05825 [Candidatus Calescamantes bacterium]|nr:hypothetical protein [Candidatus Calescamantes bacterium]
MEFKAGWILVCLGIIGTLPAIFILFSPEEAKNFLKHWQNLPTDKFRSSSILFILISFALIVLGMYYLSGY